MQPFPGRAFETTRWSLIVAAGEHSRPALGELCQIYWNPVFGFFRNRFKDSEAARDFTQSFFASLLEKELLARADPARGRFRSFLLSSARNYLSNELEKERSQKRGGHIAHQALDQESIGFEPADPLTPETVFAQEWAVALLKRVMDRFLISLSPLQSQRFDALKDSLLGVQPAPSYAEIAGALDMTEIAVKVTAHRFRKQFGQYLREEVADTVQDADLVEKEIRFLLEAFSGQR